MIVDIIIKHDENSISFIFYKSVPYKYLEMNLCIYHVTFLHIIIKLSMKKSCAINSTIKNSIVFHHITRLSFL